MIGSKCRRRRSNQFNNVLLNAQDKVNYNKITEIREERNANSIYIGSVTSHATSSPQATHFRFSTIFVNSLQLLNTPWDSSPLCSGFSQVKR